MIDIIGRNRILEYVTINPEATIPLLIWLKEKQINRLASRDDESGLSYCQLGASKYYVEIKIRNSLEIAYIDRMGQIKEPVMSGTAEENSEIANEKKISTSIVIATPPPVSKMTLVDPKDRIGLPSFSEPETSGQLVKTFDSEAEYKRAIERAIAIFDSHLGTPDFEELTTLVPLIKSYEAQHIQLPKLELVSAVKYRMGEFQIKPEELPPLIGSQEEISLFLAGKQLLPEAQLQTLLKLIGFRFRL